MKKSSEWILIFAVIFMASTSAWINIHLIGVAKVNKKILAVLEDRTQPVIVVQAKPVELNQPVIVKRYDPPEDPHALEKIEAEKKEALKPTPLPPCPLTDLGHGS